MAGHGDGGGGPQMEMLERINRMHNVDGLPKVTLESPSNFFNRAKQDQHKLETWTGELVLISFPSLRDQEKEAFFFIC